MVRKDSDFCFHVLLQSKTKLFGSDLGPDYKPHFRPINSNRMYTQFYSNVC